MPQPPKYQRAKDFTVDYGDQTDHAALNSELDAAASSINSIRTNLALLQRDDGKLKQGVVTADSVDPTFIDEISAGVVSQVDGAVAAAEAAAVSATNAALTATAASTSASASQVSSTNSATAAGLASQSASASANAAQASQTAAAASQTAAAASQTSASGSATSAGNSATAAAASATTATTQAGVATTKAGEASTSATSANAALTDLKGRYYGGLSADPSVDPNGNPMDAGDLFANTTTGELRRYSGSAWVTAFGGIPNDGTVTYPKLDSALQGLMGQGVQNRIINGEMRIPQRATSFTGTPNGYQTLDRWGCSIGSGSGHTVGQVADGPAGFRHCFGVTIGTGAAPGASNFNGLWQNIEGYNVADFMYGTANAAYGVFSFSVRSSIPGTYSVAFMNGSLTRNFIRNFTINAANTWERKYLILPGDTSGSWDFTNGAGLSICWDMGSGSNWEVAPDAWGAGQKYRAAGTVQLAANSGATFRVTGVKFEPGQIATPYTPRVHGSELALCQRYYQSINPNRAVGQFYSTTAARFQLALLAEMRAVPTILLPATLTAEAVGNGPTTFTVSPGASPGLHYAQFDLGGATVARATYQMAVFTGGNIGASAEL